MVGAAAEDGGDGVSARHQLFQHFLAHHLRRRRRRREAGRKRRRRRMMMMMMMVMMRRRRRWRLKWRRRRCGWERS